MNCTWQFVRGEENKQEEMKYFTWIVMSCRRNKEAERTLME